MNLPKSQLLFPAIQLFQSSMPPGASPCHQRPPQLARNLGINWGWPQLFCLILLNHFEMSHSKDFCCKMENQLSPRHQEERRKSRTWTFVPWTILSATAPKFQRFLPRVETGGQKKSNPPWTCHITHTLFSIHIWGRGCHANLFLRVWIYCHILPSTLCLKEKHPRQYEAATLLLAVSHAPGR